ncbi:MAG: uracil-DNA glycosylase [Candidatus Tectomicrobia bacterium]|nr:uracil-DNA glycosylase [Candidatus Tectomicrobia bacterium]
MKNQLNSFIGELSAVKLSSHAFNQYSHGNEENSVRRANLLLYFQQMAEFHPQILLVGEAVGYRGSRLTGVPFTSESILLNGIEELGLFGRSRGYQKTGEFKKVWKEPTATMVWETFVNLNIVPLSWNAFPFHPFKNHNGQSNRTPTHNELKTGEKFLGALIELFEVETIIAVGEKAETALKNIGRVCKKVRHPSHGGKHQFAHGMREMFNASQ